MDLGQVSGLAVSMSAQKDSRWAAIRQGLNLLRFTAIYPKF
jgi:hypothetical protein